MTKKSEYLKLIFIWEISTTRALISFIFIKEKKGLY